MEHINSLDDLVEALADSKLEDFPHILKRINIDDEDLAGFCNWEEGEYTRNCLDRKDEYELVLICWDRGAETPIHGHDGQKCWVYQLRGALTEIRYDKNPDGQPIEAIRTSMDETHLSYMDDTMGYHILRNDSSDRCLTLHLYVSPIDNCKVYNEKRGCFESVDMEYDSINESAMAVHP